MTTTETQPGTPGQRAHAAAVELLDATIAALLQQDWTRHSVSTLAYRGGQKIRHHYTGGIWELRFTCEHGNQTPTVRHSSWDVRKPLPASDTVLAELRGNSRCWPIAGVTNHATTK